MRVLKGRDKPLPLHIESERKEVYWAPSAIGVRD